ncbi:glycoside hydrolase family 76 protein [[Candida] arabinofermentans NRRL YB-2248]|uniref:Glycoside hydrolase family 76 protein n=1 Tax=[Candida] arabinofermentans NRRL YB-2248 TaxID=983967 RepID=A0A1E4ST15_9ASCO|nr:glycoside hydrolase family 76 protein [[Candida] arabinofermentans NRRL YB-2248]
MSFDNNLEGYNIVKNMWFQYWNPSINNFSTKVPCHESRDGKFSCWTMGVVLHAIGESCMVYKDLTLPIVEPTVRACLNYRNPKNGGYSVLYHGGPNSGDDDINYDDADHLLRGMLVCYEATGNKEYLELSKELMRFLMGGLKEHESFKVTGMKWHISRKYMSTISNCVSATCAMKLIPYSSNEDEKRQLYEYAKVCMNFIFTKMFDPNDNLIWDGVAYDSEVIDKQKYSYNTGNTITALCLLYKYDHNNEWAEKAKKLAEAATHRGRTLYDRDYDDWSKRFWHGPSYFIQLLIEGLADYLETFDETAPQSTKDCCKQEILRHLSYFRKYCYDPQDGGYYTSFDIFKIDEKTYKRYKEEFKGHKKFDPCAQDRVGGSNDTPIKDRPMSKSLMGAASAARIFFQGARVFPKMDPVDV